MENRGYIYFSRISDKSGRIRACSGDFAGLNIAFARDDCDAPLRKILAQTNISRDRVCPPPADVLLVSFDLSVQDGDLSAINVTQI